MNLSKTDIERMQILEKDYRVIVNYPLLAARPIKLMDHDNQEDRFCRFCGKKKGEVTFKKKAHAIPEFLGNKCLRSFNECDSCNELFSEYEDHLSKRLGAMRSLCMTPGKKGVPTFKNEDIRIEDDNGLRIGLKKEIDAERIFNSTTNELKLPDLKTEKHIPIKAAMALVKSACSILPSSELNKCKGTINWLMRKDIIKINSFPILYSFTPGICPYGEGKAVILRRKTGNNVPYLWVIIASSNFRFQVMIPFCSEDQWQRKGAYTYTVAHFPAPFSIEYHKKYGETKYGTWDFAGDTPVQVTHSNITFHYDNAVEKKSQDKKTNME